MKTSIRFYNDREVRAVWDEVVPSTSSGTEKAPVVEPVETTVTMPVETTIINPLDPKSPSGSPNWVGNTDN